MRRFLLSALLACGLATASAAHVDPKSPESAVLLPVQVLLSNDYQAFFKTLPQSMQDEAVADWRRNQEKLDGGSFDAFIGKLLAPNAVDELMKQAGPGLATYNPEEIAQGMRMGGAMLPMMLMAGGGGAGKPPAKPTAEETQAISNLGSILTAAADWLPTAKFEDPQRLRAALEKLIAGAKATGIKDAAGLKALAYGDLLAKLPPLIKGMKDAAAIYEVKVDDFLKTITATSTGEGDARVLVLGFTAFGKSFTQGVKVERRDAGWQVSPDAFPMLKALANKQAGLGAEGPAETGAGLGFDGGTPVAP